MTVRQKNVWIVHGEDAVQVQEKKAELLTRYFKRNVPEPTILEPGASVADYRYALGGLSLFSTQTAVVGNAPYFFKRALRKEDEDLFPTFLAELQEISEDIFVVIVCEGKPDKRFKAVKELFKIASDLECPLLKPETGVELVDMRLSDAGKRLTPSARALLTDVLASWSQLSRPFLMTECDKLVLMAGDAREISKELLETALPDYMDRGIFRFTEQLLARDATAVLDAADHVFTDTDSILKNTGFLASKFRQIKMLKEMNRMHAPVSEKMKILAPRGAWQMRALEAEAKLVSEKEATDFLEDIFRVQYAARRGVDTEIKDILLRFCLKKKA